MVIKYDPADHTWTTHPFHEMIKLSCPVVFNNRILLYYCPKNEKRTIVFKTYDCSNNKFEDVDDIPDIKPYSPHSRCMSNRLFTVDMSVI